MAADEDAKGPGEAAGNKAGESGDRRTGQRQRPSVTIDLTAEEVRAKAAAADSPTPAEPARESTTVPPPRAPTGRRTTDQPGSDTHRIRGAAARVLAADDGWQRSALAGVAGGLVALIVVIFLQAIGVLPAPGRSAANQAIEQSKAASDASAALDKRLTAVEAMTESIPGIRADAHALTDRTEALEAARATFADRGDLETATSDLAALRQKMESAPQAVTRDDLVALTERLARIEVAVAAGGGGDGAATEAVASLTKQLADAETQVRSLSDRIAMAEAKVASGGGTPVAGGEGALRAVAVAALRRAADGDQPFSSDVDLISALGIAGDDVAALRAIAAKGVSARSALAAEFPEVAEAILAATSASDPNAGFWRRLGDSLSSLVTIRPTGPVAGTDPPAIVSRMRDAVGKGDLATALAEGQALPEPGKAAAATWAAKAADRVALDALVERIARAFDVPKSGRQT